MLSLDAAQTAPTVALTAQIVKSKTKVDRQAFEADAELAGGHHEFRSLGLCCRLSDVKSLNCWGQDLTDVTILCEMPNVEVLSLSVNRISTLKYVVIKTCLCCQVYTCMVAGCLNDWACLRMLRDFSQCLKLQELYLRKNEVFCSVDCSFAMYS